jgi:hypothetical protein
LMDGVGFGEAGWIMLLVGHAAVHLPTTLTLMTYYIDHCTVHCMRPASSDSTAASQRCAGFALPTACGFFRLCSSVPAAVSLLILSTIHTAHLLTWPAPCFRFPLVVTPLSAVCGADWRARRRRTAAVERQRWLQNERASRRILCHVPAQTTHSCSWTTPRRACQTPTRRHR